jgi:hypothetical protein
VGFYGRTIFVTDAHRGDGKRFVVHADEKLTAFLELESLLGMKSAKRASRGSHFYRCAKCGQLVDMRELRDVIFHETDHKPNPLIRRIRGTRIRTRRR